MRLLVTGGTGFVGRHLVTSLAKNGMFVRMLARKTSDLEELENLGVQIVYGDITDTDSLDGITRNIDVVFHLAAQLGKWGIPESQYHAINVHGTRNLLEASLHGGARQFVFCSTPGVQGKGYRQAKETLPYAPPYIYELTKCLAEKIALEFNRNGYLPVTIIRPDFVYGPGDYRRLPLYRAIRDKRFLIVGDGKSLLHPTYIDDVIQGFHLVTNNSVAFGQIYNIAGPGLITVEDYVKDIANVLNVPPPTFKVPKPIALSAAFLTESLSKIADKEPFITRSKIDFLTNSHGSDITKAVGQLHYNPQIEFADGVKETVRYYLNSNLI